MATTVESLMSLTQVPLGPNGEPLRRSERLNKLKSEDEIWQGLQKVKGTNYERLSLYNHNGVPKKLYAVKALDINLDNLWPGKIVKAIDCYPQTDLKCRPYDGTIGATSIAGPIAAKFRYMIVLWRTNQGVAAIPLYTQTESKLSKNRMGELVSVCTVGMTKWPGDTPWAGMPILVSFNPEYNCENKCYADLSRPHWIGQCETILDDVGHVEGGEYSRLIDLLHMKEREFRTAAFARFKTKPDGTSETWDPWTPTSNHQPKAKERFKDDKVNRMNFQEFKHGK
ncbi:unnamed protein product [Aureobasidium uvarum]|uniref:Uncharacterized protein n=1 Tax=Aureobasidium uvarum TaxID=2773716 RepID=A0A9N8PPD7_9PEZI|nr:unnamed protein product [Aureobasidium uvarum]